MSPKQRKTLPPLKPVPVPMFDTPLTRLFLQDPCAGGTLVDVDPYDTYVLAGTDGEVDYITTFRAIVPLFPFNAAIQLERAILRMFLSVAKHCHRFTVVTPRFAHRFMLGSHKFAGTRALSLCGVFPQAFLSESFEAPGIPNNIVISVDDLEPELFGRILFDGHSRYGMVLFAPRVVSAVEVVPTPWGFPGEDQKPQRLPSLE